MISRTIIHRSALLPLIRPCVPISARYISTSTPLFAATASAPLPDDIPSDASFPTTPTSPNSSKSYPSRRAGYAKAGAATGTATTGGPSKTPRRVSTSNKSKPRSSISSPSPSSSDFANPSHLSSIPDYASLTPPVDGDIPPINSNESEMLLGGGERIPGEIDVVGEIGGMPFELMAPPPPLPSQSQLGNGAATKRSAIPSTTTSTYPSSSFSTPNPQPTSSPYASSVSVSTPSSPSPSQYLTHHNQTPHNWTTSFHGLSIAPFEEKAAKILMRELTVNDVEVKPDGLLYLPEIKYRRTLNQAFGPGGWGLAPRGETTVSARIVSREWGLVVLGRLVAIARGEQEYFDPSGIPTATEACKSNALMRCCKDLGIASELWDPTFIREFKKKHCTEAFVEHVVQKKKKKLWRKNTAKFEYPYKET